jgi:hypothetical protein
MTCKIGLRKRTEKRRKQSYRVKIYEKGGKKGGKI